MPGLELTVGRGDATERGGHLDPERPVQLLRRGHDRVLLQSAFKLATQRLQVLHRRRGEALAQLHKLSIMVQYARARTTAHAQRQTQLSIRKCCCLTTTVAAGRLWPFPWVTAPTCFDGRSPQAALQRLRTLHLAPRAFCVRAAE